MPSIPNRTTSPAWQGGGDVWLQIHINRTWRGYLVRDVDIKNKSPVSWFCFPLGSWLTDCPMPIGCKGTSSPSSHMKEMDSIKGSAKYLVNCLNRLYQKLRGGSSPPLLIYLTNACCPYLQMIAFVQDSGSATLLFISAIRTWTRHLFPDQYLSQYWRPMSWCAKLIGTCELNSGDPNFRAAGM